MGDTQPGRDVVGCRRGRDHATPGGLRGRLRSGRAQPRGSRRTVAQGSATHGQDRRAAQSLPANVRKPGFPGHGIRRTIEVPGLGEPSTGSTLAREPSKGGVALETYRCTTPRTHRRMVGHRPPAMGSGPGPARAASDGNVTNHAALADGRRLPRLDNSASHGRSVRRASRPRGRGHRARRWRLAQRWRRGPPGAQVPGMDQHDRAPISARRRAGWRWRGRQLSVSRRERPASPMASSMHEARSVTAPRACRPVAA